MSELTHGMFRGMLSHPEFTRRLHRVVEFAEEQQGVAGFTAQRYGKNNFVSVDRVQYPEAATAGLGARALIDPEVYGKVGVFVTGRPPVTGEAMTRTVLPTREELTEFQDLLRDNPHMIRGIVMPEVRFGGALSFFCREQEPGSLRLDNLPEEYLGPEAFNPRSALAEAGLHCARIEFPLRGTIGEDSALFGMRLGEYE